MEARAELMPEVKGEVEGSVANAWGQYTPALRVIRAKGVVWLAGEAGLAQQGVASLAGRIFTISPGPPWWASIGKTEWPEGLAAAIEPLWTEPWGDRQNEVRQALRYVTLTLELITLTSFPPSSSP